MFCSLQKKDLLQLLFEASKDGEKKLLSDGEMIADIIFILLAGYDTTSNTLAYTAYLLALNPEVQEKLANHILTYFEDNPVSTWRGRGQEHIPFDTHTHTLTHHDTVRKYMRTHTYELMAFLPLYCVLWEFPPWNNFQTKIRK